MCVSVLRAFFSGSEAQTPLVKLGQPNTGRSDLGWATLTKFVVLSSAPYIPLNKETGQET